jgi:hypothetical protein
MSYATCDFDCAVASLSSLAAFPEVDNPFIFALTHDELL